MVTHEARGSAVPLPPATVEAPGVGHVFVDTVGLLPALCFPLPHEHRAVRRLCFEKHCSRISDSCHEMVPADL